MAKITLVSSRCHEIFLPVVMALVFLSFGPSVVLRADPPDPRVLLKGVEDSRISIPSGRIDLIVETTNLRQPKSGVRRKQLKIAFDGPKRRFDQYEKVLFVDGTKPGASDPGEKLRAMGGDTEAFVRAGLGTLKDVHIRSAYDGTQFMQYSEDMGAYVRDASKGSPDYAFDPRVMGITVWFTLDDDVPGDLGYRDAKSIRSMGETILDGHTVWHVLVVDKSDRERHFWIDAQDFRVYKMTLQSQFQHLSSISEFKEQSEFRNLPSRITFQKFDADGHIRSETTYSVTRAVAGPIDPKLWTLAGLDMPLGEMVIDERIHKVIGHFDGQGVTPNVNDAIQKGKSAKWRPLHWGMAVTGLIVLAVLAATLVYRRNLLRREA